MFLTHPSVSQSVLFLLSAQLLWNHSTEFRETFVVMKDIMRKNWIKISCGYAHRIIIQRKFWFNFFSRSYALFEQKFGQNEVYYSKVFVSTTPLKPLNRISWNFVVNQDIMCRCACIFTGNFDSIFFLGVTPFFELRNLPKMKDTTQNSLSAQLLWNRSTEFPETL